MYKRLIYSRHQLNRNHSPLLAGFILKLLSYLYYKMGKNRKSIAKQKQLHLTKERNNPRTYLDNLNNRPFAEKFKLKCT